MLPFLALAGIAALVFAEATGRGGRPIRAAGTLITVSITTIIAVAGAIALTA
jgi:hypothetical protein